MKAREAFGDGEASPMPKPKWRKKKPPTRVLHAPRHLRMFAEKGERLAAEFLCQDSGRRST
jgi:hypothetical protein